MEQAYDGHGGSFTSMLSALLTSDAYRMRRVPGAGECPLRRRALPFGAAPGIEGARFL
jgi:hypothetical protein